MNHRIKLLLISMLIMAFLTGCGLYTVDEMYCLPKRPANFYSLQKAIDQVMVNMEYCAPLTGEHQQTVQTADLNGDGILEYLLFARGTGEKPLNIFIFRQDGQAYNLDQTISCNGSAFEQVRYVQLDGKDGMELVIGCQVSDQVLRSASVYSFAEGDARQLLSTSYAKLLIGDFNNDNMDELMVFHPGQSEADNGLAELIGFPDGLVNRSKEVSLSQPVSRLKRTVFGRLEDGTPAVYAASAADENALVTDILTVSNEKFQNISRTDIQPDSNGTLRNYQVYATDINGDGIIEIPRLIRAASLFQEKTLNHQWVVEWYSMDRKGNEFSKLYTFHNFQNGWYFNLRGSVAPDTIVVLEKINPDTMSYSFGTWDSTLHENKVYLTVYEITGPDREETATVDNRFVLYRGDSTIYTARLETVCVEYGITQDDLVQSFNLIHKEWNSGKNEE